ncbi:Oleosin 16 kDa [Apostasia shenzhenica]|uniref:Oleosin 16 kDa n=1 Tax=Apostasia shenzhenica TaxID=1088818 RepID=A0A2I0ATN6_9ASPA|nr:Oleosin 16 kDa [Apostasia shenzhenica]
MADPGGGDWGQNRPEQQQPVSHMITKAVAAAAAGGSMLLMSGLTLAGTVILLTIATPLLVIFSPVLLPAAIAVVLIGGGFVTSGGFGVAALSVLSWMYRYMTGKHPIGAEQIDQARRRIAAKARDVKEMAKHQAEPASS